MSIDLCMSQLETASWLDRLTLLLVKKTWLLSSKTEISEDAAWNFMQTQTFNLRSNNPLFPLIQFLNTTASIADLTTHLLFKEGAGGSHRPLKCKFFDGDTKFYISLHCTQKKSLINLSFRLPVDWLFVLTLNNLEFRDSLSHQDQDDLVHKALYKNRTSRSSPENHPTCLLLPLGNLPAGQQPGCEVGHC